VPGAQRASFATLVPMNERFTWDEGSGASGTSKEAAGWVIAHCDGGSRGNPGPAGFGVVLEDESGAPVAELSEFLGVKTNNFAEYSGMLAALEYALTHGHPKLRVVADSELMVKQMKGQYRVNSPELRPLWEEAKRRVARLERFEIQHVLRGKNKGADRLANLAMDRGTGRTVVEARSVAASPVAKPVARPDDASPGKTRSADTDAVPKIARPAAPPRSASGSARHATVLRGFVKNGVVHLLEGELPENAFVRVTLE
jgi:ribonuclease HI